VKGISGGDLAKIFGDIDDYLTNEYEKIHGLEASVQNT